MHTEVKRFCEAIKRDFPQYFVGKNVLDCGSLDINGSNRYLFEKCNYTGIDIATGKNVDIVTPVHEFKPAMDFDVVISTEMLEHDRHYILTLKNMFWLLKPNGLLLFTAAGTGRSEHGTTRMTPADSPMTHDYYRNITVDMILEALSLDDFSWFEISYVDTDIRFAGIKR
jgi:SAM-dependent methyltransferase